MSTEYNFPARGGGLEYNIVWYYIGREFIIIVHAWCTHHTCMMYDTLYSDVGIML